MTTSNNVVRGIVHILAGAAKLLILSIIVILLYSVVVKSPYIVENEDLKEQLVSTAEEIAGFRYNLFQLNKELELREKQITELEREVEYQKAVVAAFKKQYTDMYIVKETAVRRKDEVIKAAIIPENNVPDAVHNHVVVPMSEKAHEASRATQNAFEAAKSKLVNLVQ